LRPQSNTETYAALRLSINNWRWQGVPFYLRSGKRLARRVSEIAINFRRPPGTLFAGETRASTSRPTRCRSRSSRTKASVSSSTPRCPAWRRARSR
jgi:glucose-6-phosphate 1-dehydrogenase